jgi:hypothetical protein
MLGPFVATWSFRFREAKYDADYTQIINQLQERIQRSDPNFTFPHYLQEITLDEVRGHYTKASKQLRDIQNKSTEARLQSYQDLSPSTRTTMTPTKNLNQIVAKARIVKRTMRTESHPIHVSKHQDNC